jgi:hypothetical protein
VRCLAVFLLLLVGSSATADDVPFQFTEEWQAQELNSLIGGILSAPLSKHECELPTQKLGPRYSFLVDEEELFTIEQALTNPAAIPPDDKLLASHKCMWDRLERIKSKLHYGPTAVWPGGQVRRQLTFNLGQMIMVRVALSRYHCRETRGPGFVRWIDDHGQAQQINEIAYWGEDDGADDQERTNKFSPEMCDYYNERAEALYKRIYMPSMRTWGGVSWYTFAPPWWMLDMATAWVQGQK